MWTQARHIQVSTEQEAIELMELWQGGGDFAELARRHSQCPTARQSGDLGLFAEGHMPEELDRAFQQGEIGCIYGPIKSEWGYHLVEVLSRRTSS